MDFSWKSALRLLGGAAVLMLLPLAVWASNCSSKFDCWHVARGAAAAAAGAGVAAAAAASGRDDDYT